ncbi:TonB-dependent receptor [Brevundimonas sp. A19_0]|uniref:TonB-dependent receptor plug domain-containing protein n=1 Tax=Brevundimonas sp. A19_0 TaxID=2821087 RepID=UPI001ADC93ED|nr:TonB-dependent receptor [Brevundimonas sp. A19_0]MBO9500359.1 TonB-dependent receptor plug domain-containing protein [Brevundimonas sp. A19_0]
MTRNKLLITTAAAAIAMALAPQALAQEARGDGTASPGASANNRDQGILVFTPDFFADQNPNTALDMVQRVPGFSVSNGDGGRGFEGAVGNILINGARPASKNDTGSSVLSRTLVSQVERIELIRGGAPGIDMQGYSVVVNVILKRESSRQTVLTGNATLFDGGTDIFGGSYQFTARDGERSWGFTLSDGMGMSDSNGTGPSIRRAADGTILREEAFENDGYGGGQSLRGNYAAPAFGGKIDLTARYGTNDWHSYDQFTGAGTFRQSRYDEDGTSGEVGVVYTRPLSDRVSMETRFIHEFSDFDSVSTYNADLGGGPDPEQLFESVGEASETIARGLLRFERSDALTFEGGGEVAYNRLDTDQAFSIGGTPVVLPSATVLVEETRAEVFGKSSWRISPTLSLESGLRLEHSTISQSGDTDTEKSFFFAKPRVQVSWTPMANTQVRARFEREVGQLSFGDFAASAELDSQNVLGGNADLEPEDRWISELTFERRFWGDGIVSIGLRHDEIGNVIDLIPLQGGLSAVGNIGDGTLDQLSLNITVPTDKLGISGGQFGFRNDWNKTEVTDPTTGEARAISGVRARQPVVSFSQDITSWKVNWSVAWITVLGQTTYDPDQTVGWKGGDYFELAAEYKPTPSLSIRAQLNLWDNFDVERTVYSDRTSPRPIAFIERREIDPRTFVSLRVRKTF